MVNDQDRGLSIAYVSPAWPVDAGANGVVPYVADMAYALRRAGHRSYVLTRPRGGDRPDWVIDYDRGGAGRPPLDRVMSRLMPLIDQEYYTYEQIPSDIVWALRGVEAGPGVDVLEMEEAFGWPGRVRPRTAVPVAVRLHGPWFLNGPLRGAASDASFERRVAAEGEAIRLAPGVTAPSLDVLQRTRQYYGLTLEDAEVISPPAPVVDPTDRWRLDACEPRTILFVGRFDGHKGGDVVIEAFVRVSSEHPDLRLLFVGPDLGLYDAQGRWWQIRDFIADRAPGRRVEWLGLQPKSALPRLRREAFLTVVASRYETFGLTVTEAMAYGCPLVATRAGAIPEFAHDGETALLCPPEDPHAMAAAFGRLLADPGLAETLGRRAGEVAASRFNPDAIARELVGFYRRMLGRLSTRSDRAAVSLR